MADDELEYDDLYFDDGDNYFYIDDGYALADELAESSVPDPGINDFADDWDDLTRFEYFNDLEYDSDGFNDVTTHIRIGKRPSAVAAQDAKTNGSKKRKRESTTVAPAPLKRRKIPNDIRAHGHTMPSVVLQTEKSVVSDALADVSELKPYSVLPHWREQFKNVNGVASVFSDAIARPLQVSLEGDASGEEDDATEDPGEEMLDASDAMKALGMSLERKLSAMGLDVSRIDQSKLLLLAQKMMTGDADTEELLAEIIEGIHGGEADENEEAERDPFSQWVAGNTGKNADEADATDKGQGDGKSERGDSLVDTVTIGGKDSSTLQPRHTNGASSSSTGRKRKPMTPETTSNKRKQSKRAA